MRCCRSCGGRAAGAFSMSVPDWGSFPLLSAPTIRQPNTRSRGTPKTLDHEVREFGVRVAVIEPAATRTSFEASTAPSDTPIAAYDASRAKYLVAYERAMSAADTAESVAETIVRAARDKTPRLRYPSGKAARQVAFARRFVPRPCSTRCCARNSDWRSRPVCRVAHKERAAPPDSVPLSLRIAVQSEQRSKP